MARFTRSLLAAVLALGAPAVQARTAADRDVDRRVAERVLKLNRATRWTQVAAIPIRFRTFHPQGMVRIGNETYVSSVEIRVLPRKLPTPIDGHAYDAGVGVGHLFKIGADGALIADLILGEGSIYHPGGIDYDGTSILVPVAEYRPDSRAIIYRVSPRTMTATKIAAVADHIGGVVHDVARGRLVAISWGARRFYDWPMMRDGTVPRASVADPIANIDNYIDYQDCHYLGGRSMLCSGIADYQAAGEAPAVSFGGIDLVDLPSHRPVWQVPIAMRAPSGRSMTQNPFWVEATATGLRAYFMPDDDASTLFVFDAVLPG